MTTLTTKDFSREFGVPASVIHQWSGHGYIFPVNAGERPLRFQRTDVVENLARWKSRKRRPDRRKFKFTAKEAACESK